jgi:hypothetical protein
MKKTTKIEMVVSVLAMSCLLAAACGGEREGLGSDPVESVQSALAACVPAAPVVTEIREEQPGAVAPGVGKVYFVTVRNANSATCAPATITFVPDSFQFFSVVAQPASAGGVASGATTQFRVTVTSDPSVPPGTTSIGFTLVSGSTSARGALTFVVTLDNPVGCNRQRPAIAIDNAQPPPVPPQTAVTYRVTVRNVDNRECGADTFTLSPFALHFVTVTTNGPFTIPAQGSAVFNLTIQASDVFGPGSVINESFDVIGAHHGALTATGTVVYRIR